MKNSIGTGRNKQLQNKENVQWTKLSIMSGGEYQHLQVASFVTTIVERRVWLVLESMILDEPDTFVDDSGVKKMIYDKKQTENMSTIIVSHTNSMHRDVSLFEHHIEIERDNNGSRKRKEYNI